MLTAYLQRQRIAAVPQRIMHRLNSTMAKNTVERKNSVVLLGFSTDCNSSFLTGSRKAPPLIRKALYSESSNLWSEAPALHVTEDPRFVDFGDLDGISSGSGGFQQIQDHIHNIWVLSEQQGRVLALGGDHSITYPILTSKFYAKERNLSILHIDAHPDLYDNFEGNPYSHASPFARVLEHRSSTTSCTTGNTRLIQVGIRTMNDHQREQADRFGVEVILMDDISRVSSLIEKIEGPLYLSIDLDGLDPAFAPGVSHHEPGGLSTRQVIDWIHRIRCPLIGADVVEYNPDRDVNGITAMVAAKLVKEIAAKMLVLENDDK